MFTTKFIIFLFTILLFIDAVSALVTYNMQGEVNQLRTEVGSVVITPIPTAIPVAPTASPSATIAPVVKVPVRVVTVAPVVSKAVVK